MRPALFLVALLAVGLVAGGCHGSDTDPALATAAPPTAKDAQAPPDVPMDGKRGTSVVIPKAGK